MEINRLPVTDLAKLGPGECCPEFDPAAWDRLDLHFKDKRFVRAQTRSLFHIPLNMSNAFARTWAAVKAAGAGDPQFVILSNDCSPWRGEHYFSVTKNVDGLDNATLTGHFVTRVFEGPYRQAYVWVREMREDVALMGHRMGRLFFYYTTCPKCAEKRGKNYVVAVAELV